MTTNLREYRLVFVGPAEGQTAVGDYAQDFVTAVKPHFGDVAEVRTRGPGGDRVRDILAYRRAVAALVAEAPTDWPSPPWSPRRPTGSSCTARWPRAGPRRSGPSPGCPASR
ncbi:hypothetical protein AAHH97_06060 [Mycolicibacterium elephantis]|uniref:hypothetical protein n=1 Tax=Mycolicibacterium elephantis TaxID=81858 RepID=UPI003A8BD643